MNFSKYNLYVKSQDSQKLLIFNSFRNKVITLNKKFYQNIDFNNVYKIPEDIFNFLLQHKFIVNLEDEEKELNKLENDFFKYMNSILNITLIPSYLCNFACPYCYENHFTTKRISKTTYDKLAKLIIYSSFKNVRFSLFGGEPLLFLDEFEYFYRKIKKINSDINIDSIITTNGFFLTDRNILRLQKLNIKHYQVTIDGNKENHNKTRCLTNNEPTYDIILNNLKVLKNTCGNFTVTLRCNVSKNMELSSFLEDYTNNFNDDSRFSLLLFPVANWNEKMDCLNLFSKVDILEKYTKILKQLNINNYNKNFYLKAFKYCNFSMVNNLALLPNEKLSFCTINFKDRNMNIEEYFNNIESYNKI